MKEYFVEPDLEFVESLVDPYGPIKAVSTFRSQFDPDLFLVSARYGEFGQSACACGYDLAETRLRAIVEGIERRTTARPWSAPGGVITAASQKLDLPFLDPERYIPLDPKQAKAAALKPYSPKRKLRWVRGLAFDATTPPQLIPLDMIYYDYNSIDRLYYANSSGVAAHFSRSRALETAVTELVERDALMRFWLTGRARDISAYSLLPGYVEERMEFWRSQDCRLALYSLPSEYGDVVLATITGKTWPAFSCGAAARLRCLEATVRPNSEANLFERAVYEAEGNYVVHANCAHEHLPPEAVRSPFEHGLFYCHPYNYALIEPVLFGLRSPFESDFPDVAPVAVQPEMLYRQLDLTYYWLTELSGNKPSVQVCRVFSPKLIPISFNVNLFHARHAEVVRLCRDELKLELEGSGSVMLPEHVRKYPHFFP